MITYFKELKQDVEGISKKRNTERFYNDAVALKVLSAARRGIIWNAPAFQGLPRGE